MARSELSVGGRYSRTAGLLLFVSIVALSTTASADLSSISSNFNGTGIADTSYIWFNSHLTSVSGGTGTVEIYFRNQKIQLKSYTLLVPDATVTISGTGTASTTFDSDGWRTDVASRSGDPFLAGYVWDVPTGENPVGANPVTWSGEFYSNQAGVSIGWQWSAAVYTTFSTDYSVLGVLPIDSGGRQSGTPMNYRCDVVGGARGGGGSNFTGSNSSTGNANSLDVLPPVPVPGAVLLGTLGLSVAGWRLRRESA